MDQSTGCLFYQASPVDYASFSLSFRLSSANFALAHCAMALPAVLSQGRRGHRLRRASLATCLLRQTGGGASGVEIPCKEL